MAAENTSPPIETGPRAAVPHAVPVEAVLTEWGFDVHEGLPASEVARRQARYGPNELAEAPRPAAWRRFLAQFLEPVIGILIVAAVIAGLLGEWVDTLAILAIVVLNGALGFFQEERAERALAALQAMSAPLAKVVRDGRLQAVPARDLVPGDRLVIEAGDRIAADARLLRTYELHVEEAALTGESVPVLKDAAAVLDRGAAIGDRRNMVAMGTTAVAGKAEALVVATGMNTELGRIAGLLEHTEREPTPLQRRLAGLGRMLILVVLAIVVLIFLLRLFHGGDLIQSFLMAVSLAVAAVPEGLPAVVTLALAVGLQRLARRNALVRKLPSVETLGSVTVICSDKTGTLTKNQMTVREIATGSGRFQVTGSGYDPSGGFRPLVDVPETGTGTEGPIEPRSDPDLARVLEIAAWCNTAQVVRGPEGNWQAIGDPTEGALIVAARKAGIEVEDRDERVVHEMPFDSERKAMSVVVRQSDDRLGMYTKGAPEVVLGECVGEWRQGRVVPLTPERREAILHASADMAERALRVLALADRDLQANTLDGAPREEDLVLVGLVGMIDPPREDARAAVETCKGAGIRPVMITGDHPATAIAIARELGIARDSDRALSGTELDAMNDAALTEVVERASVYARVAAEHKLRIVRAWKARKQIVAMTGDGVNDAPAVKAADIGIAMGITGTDVTKEASEMVLTDDRFSSIISAVEEGRCIFDNIRKFIHYLLSSNASEVLLMLLTAILGWPSPLTAVQLLWINLVTDGLPALALGLEPLERGTMKRPPRPPNEPVVTRRGGMLILYHGSLMAIVSIAAFGITYGRGRDLDQARAIVFCTMAFTQLFFSLACRSQDWTLPQLGVLSNPYLFAGMAGSAALQFAVATVPPLQRVLNVKAFPMTDWLLIIALALVPVTVVEVGKLVRAALGMGPAARPA